MPSTTRIRTAIAFLAVYFIWGSTYLAIRYIVAYIPPFFAAGARSLIAGSCLLAWALWKGYRPSTQDWGSSIIMGALFFLLGHGLLHWGEQTVESGIASLFVATQGLWIAVIGNVFKQEHTLLDKRTATGFVIGLLGVVVLAVSSGHMKVASYLGLIAILGSPIAWSAGVVYAKNAPLTKNNVARSGMSLLAGSILLLIVSAVTGEPRRFHPGLVPAISWISLSYLVVFGSLIAFSAYTWLLEHCSIYKVSTYTYANPIVAVLIGYFIAGEKVTPYTIIAGILVISALLLINLPGKSGRSDGSSTPAGIASGTGPSNETDVAVALRPDPAEASRTVQRKAGIVAQAIKCKFE